MNPRFPDISVQLSDADGNAFSIIGRTERALRYGGVPAEQIAEYEAEATSGDYSNVIQTTMRWVACS